MDPQLTQALVAFLGAATLALGVLVAKGQVDKKKLKEETEIKVVEKELDVDRLIEQAVANDREKRSREAIVTAILENTKQSMQALNAIAMSTQRQAEQGEIMRQHMEQDAIVQSDAFDSIKEVNGSIHQINNVLGKHSQFLGVILEKLAPELAKKGSGQ